MRLIQRAISKRIYYGWYVAGAASGIEFANAATAIAILTIFIDPMTDELGWSRTELAAATSLGAVMGASLAPFTGRLVDRIGSRAPLTLGGLLVTVACLYLASVQSLLGFYAAFAIARTADQGLIKIGAPPAVGKWFQRYRGRAIALVFFSGSTGVIFLAPVVQLFVGTWGWRAAWFLLGALMLVIGVLPSLALIRRQPEDLRLVMDGGSRQEPRVQQDNESDDPDEGGAWSLGAVSKTPAFWLIVLSLLFASAATAGVTLHLVPYLTGTGLRSGQAVTVISLMSFSSAAGIVAVGFLAERVSPLFLMASLYLLLAGGILLLLSVSTPVQGYLFGAIHGVASGAVNTLAPILWATYYGKGIMGSIHGLSRAFQVAGFALGPLVLGVAYDTSGGYDPGLLFGVLAAVSAFVLIVISSLSRTDRRI